MKGRGLPLVIGPPVCDDVEDRRSNPQEGIDRKAYDDRRPEQQCGDSALGFG